MPKIRRDSLMSLEQYAKERPLFRSRVIAHQRLRRLYLGGHVTLLFEDELTIRFQVQEMLRIERIFEEESVLGELGAYNPLVPDGSNFKATMLIEYPDAAERKVMLSQLVGIEDRTWVRVAGQPALYAVADEDMDGERAVKAPAVHFLRFELSAAMKGALLGGAPLSAGIDHPHYRASVDPVADSLRMSLLDDLVC
jgi:hypothetical protein